MVEGFLISILCDTSRLLDIFGGNTLTLSLTLSFSFLYLFISFFLFGALTLFWRRKMGLNFDAVRTSRLSNVQSSHFLDFFGNTCISFFRFFSFSFVSFSSFHSLFQCSSGFQFLHTHMHTHLGCFLLFFSIPFFFPFLSFLNFFLLFPWCTRTHTHAHFFSFHLFSIFAFFFFLFP